MGNSTSKGDNSSTTETVSIPIPMPMRMLNAIRGQKQIVVREEAAVVDEASQTASTHHGLKWWQAAFIITASTNSLGVLSLPKAIAPIGIVAALLVIPFIGLLQWYTGFVIWQLVSRYPGVTSFPELMGVFLGTWGRRIGVVMQTLVLVCIMAAHVVGFSIAFDVVSGYRLCSVLCTVIGVLIMVPFSLVRSLRDTWKISVLACISIMAAVVIALVSVAINRVPYPDAYLIPPESVTSFSKGFQTVNSILFVFMAHIAYPSLISEMRQSEDFPRALRIQALFTIAFSLFVALAFYAIIGSSVGSPVLSSAHHTLRLVAYVIAWPTIGVAAILSCVVAGTHIYRSIWEKTKPRIGSNGAPVSRWRKNLSWVGIISALWTAATLMALGIPAFEHIIPLVGALFGPAYILIMPSVFFVQHAARGFDCKIWQVPRRMPFFFALNVVILCLGIAQCTMGLKGTVEAIVAYFPDGGFSRPFSCAAPAA